MNIMTDDSFEKLVEDWIASAHKPYTPRTQQNYRATLHSFAKALRDEGLAFNSNGKRLVDVVDEWAKKLTRTDRAGDTALLSHQQQRKGKIQRFSKFAQQQGYEISDTLLNLL